ncbi:MAG: 6-phosphogluconolactonase, partial [Muribaculaceae bacterium]|nr:6-phosphogluconolactonase [Muribaculaceae bacterium]
MKTNLSSQIKLDQVPKRYYAPEGEIELAELTREEKVYTKIFETAVDGSEYIARRIADIIRRNVEVKGKCVLAMGAGNSTHSVYACLIDLCRKGEISFQDVIVFNISEFFPIQPEGPSTLQRLKQVLLDHVDIRPENIRSINPAVTMEDMYEYCRDYERAIANAGGIDLTVCEVGRTGSLAFNEPGSMASSLCRLVLLTHESRQRIASDYKCESVPTTAITLGIKNLMDSRRIITMAWGDSNASTIFN